MVNDYRKMILLNLLGNLVYKIMNIKKNYTIILSFFLLFPYNQIQSMERSSLTSREKITISLVITGFLITSYGFYRFLTWVYPQRNTTRKSIPLQSFQNIISGGDIVVRQTKSSNNGKVKEQLQYVNNKLSINQSGGRTSITQKKLTQGGITFNQLDISLKSKTSLKNINALGITQINVYQTYSQDQLISLKYPAQDCPDFLLTLEDDTLNYQSSMNQIPKNSSLEVWIHDKNAAIINTYSELC